MTCLPSALDSDIEAIVTIFEYLRNSPKLYQFSEAYMEYCMKTDDEKRATEKAEKRQEMEEAEKLVHQKKAARKKKKERVSLLSHIVSGTRKVINV